MIHTKSKALDLIEFIYEAAENQYLWPELLERLAFNLGLHNEANDRADGKLKSHELYSILLPHLKRATNLLHQKRQTNSEINALIRLFDYLPIGVLLVDKHLNVSSMNKFASNLVKNSDLICISGSNKLLARNPKETCILSQMVRAVLFENDSGEKISNTMILGHSSDNNLHSLVVLKLKESSSISDQNPEAAIFLMKDNWEYAIDENAFTAMYNVTQAEAKLMRLLAAGRTLDGAAAELGLRLHTVKTQLKSIFAKTNTHRQVDLMRLILTGPVFISNALLETKQNDNAVNKQNLLDYLKVATRKRFLLNNGEQITVSEYGEHNHFPLIIHRSNDESLFLKHVDKSTLNEYGLRLVVPQETGLVFNEEKYFNELINHTLTQWCVNKNKGISKTKRSQKLQMSS